MKNAISFILILFSLHLQGQTWTSREAFQGDSRAVPTSFTISNKGYVGLGLKIETEEPLGDMWEYDPALDRWLEIPQLIGDPRWGAFSFVINGEAYVGGGTLSPPSASANSGTFYKYNPISNSWSQEPNIPSSRSFSTGFSIDGKGYVVFGFANGERDASVIMYDPTLSGNPWTELTDIPEVVATAHAVRQPALSMILDNEAYLVGGAFISEVWKYNHINDTWASKNDVVISSTASFTIAGEGYITGRRDECLAQGNSGCSDNKDVILKYDKAIDEWINLTEVPSNMSTELMQNFAITPCDLIPIVGNSDSGEFYEFDVKSSFPTIGPSLLCNNGQGTYSVSNLPAGVSITWSKSSNLTIMAGQGTNSLTVKGMTFSNYGSQGWVKATLSSSCGTLLLE